MDDGLDLHSEQGMVDRWWKARKTEDFIDLARTQPSPAKLLYPAVPSACLLAFMLALM